MRTVSILTLLSAAAVSLAVPVAHAPGALAERAPVGIVGEAQYVDVDGNADFGRRSLTDPELVAGASKSNPPRSTPDPRPPVADSTFLDTKLPSTSRQACQRGTTVQVALAGPVALQVCIAAHLLVPLAPRLYPRARVVVPGRTRRFLLGTPGRLL